MFENPEVLSAERHASLRLSRRRGYGFARDQKAVRVALSEAIPAAGDMPLVFTGGDEPGLVAVTSLGAAPNLFINAEGRWLGRYVPAYLRRYPLGAAAGQEANQRVVVLDPEAEELHESDGEPLFDENGNRSRLLEERIQLLQAIQQEEERDRSVVAEIVAAGVLSPQEVSVGEGENQQTLAQGFQVVDREKLNALEDTKLADWARRGVMGVLEAHLHSLRHLEPLAQKALAAAQG
jgi:putative transposase